MYFFENSKAKNVPSTTITVERSVCNKRRGGGGGRGRGGISCDNGNFMKHTLWAVSHAQTETPH